jgi:hypothetical protein
VIKKTIRIENNCILKVQNRGYELGVNMRGKIRGLGVGSPLERIKEVTS